MQDCRSRIEYQGQTRYARILDRKPFIDTCYRTGHRLELKYFQVHFAVKFAQFLLQAHRAAHRHQKS